MPAPVPSRRCRPPRLRVALTRGIARLAIVVAAVAVGWAPAAPDPDRMQQLAAERYGDAGAATVAAWRQLIAEADGIDEAEILQRVNAFFNQRLAFEDDAAIWQQPDYWATPLEAMGRGAGDCEDFAIAKYMTLRLLGVPAARLRLTYVRARIGGPASTVSQAHMVLGYYPAADAEPLVLDNLIGDIRTASRRTDLFPVFSFNSEGLWVGGAAASSADPTTRLSRWRDALQRMQQEGLL
jgi:predicted transglutaminase-like cysteine proteinase